MKTIHKTKLKRPPSCTNLYVNMLSVLTLACTLYAIREYTNFRHYTIITMISMVAIALPIFFFDVFIWKKYKEPTAGMRRQHDWNLGRWLIKLVGLYGTIGILAFLYWTLPEYQGTFYNQYYFCVQYLLIAIALVGWYYMMEVDVRMKEPKDSYYQMGCLILGKWKEVKKPVIAEHARGWAVKGFFFPLMFTYLSYNIEHILRYDYVQLADIAAFFAFAFIMLYTFDLMYAVVGYVLTFKPLDTHMRSVEPTTLGWVVCLMCYQPMWGLLFSGQYFQYGNELTWGVWLADHPTLYMLWGAGILFFLFIYSLATAALGYRFSNLTYRGLVTCGPYRFTKHPAYICKSITWWMIAIPFMPYTDGWIGAVQNSALLFGLWTVYFLRARTEENHLSNYPEYVAYANWMNEHGLLRFIGKLIPYFRYDEARAKASGSLIWQKKLAAYNAQEDKETVKEKPGAAVEWQEG